MEYYLASPQAVNFSPLFQPQPERDGSDCQVLATHVPLQILQKDGHITVPDKYCHILQKAIQIRDESQFGPKRQRTDSNEVVKNGLEIWFGYKPFVSKAFVRIVCRNPNDQCFSRLEYVCGGPDKFSLGLDLEFGTDDVKMKVVASGLKIRSPELAFSTRSHVSDICHVFQLSEPLVQKLAEGSPKIRGNLSLSVSLSDEVLNLLHSKYCVLRPLSIYKMMLENAECTDLVLIPENGVEIPCHKCFLSTQSPVFQAMFKNDMQEGLNCTVKLPDMSEPAVHALLAYLYYWGITEISKSCSIAYELLLASSKYNIAKLEKSVQELFLVKEKNWFTVPVAVQLAHFARIKALDEKDETYKMIAERAVNIMKTMSNEELHECVEYQQLFSDSKYGMEFCSFLLRF